MKGKTGYPFVVKFSNPVLHMTIRARSAFELLVASQYDRRRFSE